MRAEFLRHDQFWYLLKRDLIGFTCAEHRDCLLSSEVIPELDKRWNIEFCSDRPPRSQINLFKTPANLPQNCPREIASRQQGYKISERLNRVFPPLVIFGVEL